MARVVVIGDLMTDTVAHAMLALARGSDTPASVSMHGGGSGANIAAWMAADGGDVAFVGRRGADIAGNLATGAQFHPPRGDNVALHLALDKNVSSSEVGG